MKTIPDEPALLDSIDRRILIELQDDGRMTNVDLARRAGISAPPCLRRVRALEEAGYIRGYHAKVDPVALGFNVTVFAHVGLNSQAEADLKAFEGLVQGWPEVRECHMLAGETDFLLKVVAEDWDSYQRFLTTSATSNRHWASAHPSFSLACLSPSMTSTCCLRTPDLSFQRCSPDLSRRDVAIVSRTG